MDLALSFRVRLSEPAIQTVTVDYTTSGGTAAAGGDDAPQNGTLTFLPGDTVSDPVPVSITNDLLYEEAEQTFTVTGTADATVISAAVV